MGISKLKNEKLMTLQQAIELRQRLREKGLKLTLTNGCFDLLHPGHVYFLQEAAKLGDALWIALNSSQSVKALKGPSRPIMDDAQRAYMLAALECVDGVFLFETPRLDKEITALTPDFYAKAGDYSLETLDASEREALLSAGTRIHFKPFLPGFSTTQFIQKIHDTARK